MTVIRLTISDDIARVELDKPPVNALDVELVQALSEAVTELGDSDARAVVFSGAGPTLAAGGDIRWMHARTTERDRPALRTFFRQIQSVFDDVERLPMPTLAVIRGATLGGGFELALACDLRVAADDARIGFPEATLGLLPAAGGTQRLTELVGRGLALELLYTGRLMSADEGRRLGIVNRVAPADQLDAAVDELVGEVLRSTRDAAAAIKACVRTGLVDGRRAGLGVEGERVEWLSLTAETSGLLTDFVERRDARRPAVAATNSNGPQGA